MLHARGVRAHIHRLVFAAIAGVLAAAPLGASAAEVERPSFRQGLWSFTRTIEHLNGGPSAAASPNRQQMMRCVDPTIAMAHIFKSPPIGNCVSSKPELVKDSAQDGTIGGTGDATRHRYVFAKRCDYMGPVRTEITVESEAAYTEVNVLSVGRLPRKDVVVARRMGECQTAATGSGFALMSAGSEPAGHQLAIEALPPPLGSAGSIFPK
jgi:hypothetical protein